MIPASDSRRAPWGIATRCILLALVTTALALTSAVALASSRDGAATHAFIRADYTFVQAVHGHLATSHAALLTLLRGVRDECPRAAAHSPQDAESTQLSNELIGAMVLNAARSYRDAARRFVATVKPMRWSDRGLTRTIQAYAADIATLQGLAAPSLCADVAAWAAGHYRKLPPSTVRFAPRFMAAWVGAGIQPPQLANYESPEDRALAHRALRLEELVSEFEAREVETYGELMNALEVWP